MPIRLATARPRWRRWAARFVLAVALAIGLAYLPYRLLDPADTRRIARLRASLADRRARAAQIRAENAQLRRQIDALRNDADDRAIIDRARQDLGMVFPGEVVIHVRHPGSSGGAL